MNELPIVEEFYTLQGEGFHMGKAAYFIRIGGCDIACRWCDSKISWDQSNSTFTNIDQIVEKAHSFAAKAVVVTGGEPLSFDLTNLCTKLKEKNILTFIETSGAFPLSGE